MMTKSELINILTDCPDNADVFAWYESEQGQELGELKVSTEPASNYAPKGIIHISIHPDFS